MGESVEMHVMGEEECNGWGGKVRQDLGCGSVARTLSV